MRRGPPCEASSDCHCAAQALAQRGAGIADLHQAGILEAALPACSSCSHLHPSILCLTSTTRCRKSPTWTKSASLKPRVVSAGVPMRMPPGVIALLSPGTEFCTHACGGGCMCACESMGGGLGHGEWGCHRALATWCSGVTACMRVWEHGMHGESATQVKACKSFSFATMPSPNAGDRGNWRPGRPSGQQH
eukprot:151325-Chlamydomonas_euryale.AAC.1